MFIQELNDVTGDPNNNSYEESINMSHFEALYGKKCRTPLCWSEIGEGKALGPKLLSETEERKGKLSPRFIGPFEVIERIGHIAYQLVLPLEISKIHDVFHVSMLRKY
ncbi:hypothetical protein GQ457_14G019800 [Hibiscus cannabinus]